MLDLTVEKDVIGRTPVHFGVNVEIQEHAEQLNLWDWLADSGSTIVRELHPEQSLRKADADLSRFELIATESTFEQWRQRLADDPEGTLPWSDYLFDQSVPWMGVPDSIVEYVQHRLKIEAICSLGYAPRSFSRPIVTEYPENGSFRAEMLDWAAAASAYEYYFAEMYRFATRYGVQYFSTFNEPEFYTSAFHLPKHIESDPGRYRNAWRKYDRAAYEEVYRVVGVQVAAMSFLARMAADTVEAILTDRGEPRKLLLAGPVSCAAWEPCWQAAREWLDICDYHIYTVDPGLHRQMYQSVSRRAEEAGKATSVSEYGRRGGPVALNELMFDMDRALEAGRVLMAAMSMADGDHVAPTFATFYLLSAPSTHRNYKHLLYGDMNLLDWSARDVAPRQRENAEAWHPTAAELQIRHATAAYPMFRMLTRCCGATNAGNGPLPIRAMTAPVIWQDDQGPYGRLDWLAVDAGERLIVTIINTRDQVAPAVRLLTPFDEDRFLSGVVRETTQDNRDRLVRQFRTIDGPVVMDVPARSMVQVIYCRQDITTARDVRIVEQTQTPGSLEAGLGLHQTTRLRAIATVNDQAMDLTELSTEWSSSDPGLIRTGGAGLVQCVRESIGQHEVRASLPHGPSATASVRLLA